MRTIPDKPFSLIINIHGGVEYIKTLHEIGRKLDQVIATCQPPLHDGAHNADMPTPATAHNGSQG